jgi:beta-glucosidase
LKNEDAVLPLKHGARILVAGKNADNCGHQCGGFTVDWQGMTDNSGIEGGTSIWQGIKRIAPNAELSSDPLATEADKEHHDVAVVVIGERPYAEGMGDVRAGDEVVIEAGSRIKGSLKVLEAYGSTLELSRLHPEDLACIRAITAKGIPVVTVLVSGRPLIVNEELSQSKAFVAAWLPGSEGQGVADVIFGDHDFHGRLSFAWPANEADLGQPDRNPLFDRGYGLRFGGSGAQDN